MDRGFDFWLVCQLGGFGITVDMTGSELRILYREDISFKAYNDAECRLSLIGCTISIRFTFTSTIILFLFILTK